MKTLLHLLFCFLFFIFPKLCMGSSCSDLVPWARSVCERFRNTLYDGYTDVYASGYALHVDFHDPMGPDYVENPYAWGVGIGRGRMNEAGNEDMLLFLGFEDSHRQTQLNIGYAWQAYWQPIKAASWFKWGVGYTAVIIQRPDIANGIPFPMLLDLASIKISDFTLYGMYLPIPQIGTDMGYGSIFYFFAKYSFR